MTDIASSVAGHALTPRDNKVHQAAEQTVKEKVQLISIEFLLGLKAEKQHDIYISETIRRIYGMITQEI